MGACRLRLAAGRGLWAMAAVLLPAALGATASIAQVVPVFLQAGPFGDATLLAPAPRPLAAQPRPVVGLGDIASLGSIERGRAFPAPDRIFSLRSISGAAPANADAEDDDDDDDEPRPSRPGTLPKSFAKLPDPTPFLRNRSIGPHLVPDAEYPLTDRATLGFIGQLERPDGRIGPSISSSARAATAAGTRAGMSPAGRKDVGLGLSLEYRFGH